MKQLVVKPTDTRHLFFAAIGVLAISLSDHARFPNALFEAEEAPRVERVLPAADGWQQRLTCPSSEPLTGGEGSPRCDDPKDKQTTETPISHS